MDELDMAYDDQGSVTASLEDFDASDRARSPALGMGTPFLPSHHLGFRSEESEPDSESAGPWSPPAWRKAGSGWFRQPTAAQNNSRNGAFGSRQTSPMYDSTGEGGVDGDVTLPINVPLPVSPARNTPRTSPEPSTLHSNERRHGTGSVPAPAVGVDGDMDQMAAKGDNSNNYIRFAVRAEMQHRSDPFEMASSFIRAKVENIKKSPSSSFLTAVVALISMALLRLLFQPASSGPVPDLIKVAGLAKSFEPLIHYSENGAQQIGDLQETGVAVWDLGESIRSTNMTSAPIIVRELDDLSESLKALAIEMTKFFANVDGDVDSILIVMEWAKRELAQISSLPIGTMTTAFDNFHAVLCRVGLLESSNGVPTAIGKLVSNLFGLTTPQRTKATLHRTFGEFLGVLEESINTELTYSTALFRLFEAIDQQFLNLQRTVIRETDEQEREEGELLSSLWTRVIGANASRLRKFEKNRQLLASVRQRTVRNKHVLLDHNGKLLQLKSNLEMLRKKLVSPLVRSNASSTLSIEEQIHGLDGTYEHLKTVRERQKGKLMEMIYGAGSRKASIGRESEESGNAIDGY